MFNKKIKDEALIIHKKAINRYNSAYENMNLNSERLYDIKKNSRVAVVKVEMLINSIANKSKKFETEISKIKKNLEEFDSTEQFAKEAEESAVKSGMHVGLGIGGGLVFAAIAPNALMKYAMIFGKTAGGKAIKELNGIAAKKAALAFLGGGAKAAGGAGVEGGIKLLAMLGPIGYAVAIGGGLKEFNKLNKKNKEISDKAVNEAKVISEKTYELKDLGEEIKEVADENKILYESVMEQFEKMEKYSHADYNILDDDIKISLGVLVNTTLSLSAIMKKVIE